MDEFEILTILRAGKTAVGISKTDPGNPAFKGEKPRDSRGELHRFTCGKGADFEVLGETQKNTTCRRKKLPNLIARGVQRGIDLTSRQFPNGQPGAGMSEPCHCTGRDHDQTHKQSNEKATKGQHRHLQNQGVAGARGSNTGNAGSPSEKSGSVANPSILVSMGLTDRSSGH